MYRQAVRCALRSAVSQAASSNRCLQKLSTAKETQQTAEEEVGAFTKLIEAMGFTGPLKYNKWIESVALKASMKVMTENFYAAIFGFDEGVLSDDRVLAAALWRNLFNRQCEDPRQLELAVEYVRKQMQYIDSLDGEDLLLTGEVKWRPLVEENAQSILKPTSPQYNDAGL
ncbi:UNVERIFIED_CONTAM: hypothetical protein FKN15_068999 [Acipenser sinensis]